MKKRILIALVLLAFLCGCAKAPVSETVAPQKETTQTPTTEETVAETVQTQPDALEFGYDGEYLTCLNGESALGIDVSSFQEEIDWEKVAEAGIEFVMIRVGFRGYGEKGGLVEDTYAQTNYQGAKKAGLKVGAYFFSQAITPEEAEEEANFALELTKDWKLDLPFGFDWECHTEEYRTAGVDEETLTDCTSAFCEVMVDNGLDALIYVNPVDSPKQMDWDMLSVFGLWLGQYGETLEYPEEVAMWQYTNQGTVPGISGNVDINIYFQEVA